MSASARVAVLSWLRKHLFFTLLVVVGIALRVLAVIAYHPALVFYGDSYFYLTNAAALSPDSLHPAGYAFLLTALSQIGGNLAVVPIAQHLLGLISAAVVYATLLRHGVRRWLAALGAVPLLLDGYQVDVEQMILAETLTTFLLVAGFAFLLWRSRPGYWQLVAAAACFAWAAVTRSDAIIAILPAVGLLIGAHRAKLARTALFVAPCAALLIAYAGWHAAVDGTFAIDDKLGMLLYARAATFADCGKLPIDDVPLCDTARPIDLRLRANYYLWSPLSPMRKLSGNSSSYAVPQGPLARFARDTILSQPLDYLRVTLADTVSYFKPLHTTDIHEEPVRDWQFPTTIQWQANVFVANLGFARPGQATLQPVSRSLVPWAADLLHDYQSAGFIPGPLYALALVCVATGVVRRRGYRPAAVLTLCGLLLLLVSSAVLEFDWRYVLPAQPLIITGGILSLRQFDLAVRNAAVAIVG